MAAKEGYALAYADVANLYRLKGDFQEAEYLAVGAQKQITAPTDLAKKAKMSKKALEYLQILRSLSQNQEAY